MSRRSKRRLLADPLTFAQRRAAERLAQRHPEAWGLNQDALSLPANTAIEMRSGRERPYVRRRDLFDRLLAGERREVLAAVRRLQADIGVRISSAGGVARYAERLDADPGDDTFADLRLRVGARIERVLALAGPASSRLLLALIEPEAALGRSADWRSVVEKASGQSQADAQVRVLVGACTDLAEAYVDFDRSRF